MISRYVALLNQNAVGLPVSVFISIKLERQQEDDLDRFEAEVGTYPEVLECYLMTGTRDYLLRVATRDLAAYERFLKTKLTRVDNVASIESSFALKQVKYTRSEEHTSELQSLMRISYAVFCLKKKRKSNKQWQENTWIAREENASELHTLKRDSYHFDHK